MADGKHWADGIDWDHATPEQIARRARERGGDGLSGVTLSLPDGTVVFDTLPSPAVDDPDEITVEDAGIATGELYRPPESASNDR